MTKGVRLQVTKVPKDVQKERALEAKAANAARSRKAQEENDAKTKMKGKNRGTKRHRKRQDNIIEVCGAASCGGQAAFKAEQNN